MGIRYHESQVVSILTSKAYRTGGFAALRPSTIAALNAHAEWCANYYARKAAKKG